MSEGYWAGALWVYHSTITGQAGQGAGAITWLIIPGAGNEMEVLYGEVINGDTVARIINVDIETDQAGERLARLINTSVSANEWIDFPTTDENASSSVAQAGPRWIVSGTMRFLVTVIDVAQAQDAALGIVARIRGSLPMVTEGSAGTPVITDLTERPF